MNLYSLTKQQRDIADMIENGDEITPGILLELNKNSAMLTADLMTTLEVLEISRDAAKEKAKEWAEKSKNIAEKADKLETVIISIIRDYGQQNEINYNGLQFKLRNNPEKVIVEDENIIPDQYKKATIKVSLSDAKAFEAFTGEKLDMTIDIDKKAIKEISKKGVNVVGTKLERSLGLKR